MPRQKKPVEEYCHSTVKISDFEASVTASINWEIHDKRRRSPDTNLYEFDSHLHLYGDYIYPDERIGHTCSITVSSRDPNNDLLNPTLDNFQVREDDGSRKYRKARGQLDPVYRIPKGMGLFGKTRGKNNWDGTIWVPQHIVAQMTVLLTSSRTLYIEMIDIKAERKRRLTHLSLQTSNPIED